MNANLPLGSYTLGPNVPAENIGDPFNPLFNTLPPQQTQAQISTASPVQYVRSEVVNAMWRWQCIRAAIDGEDAVKALGEIVLPRPNPLDTSAENFSRYEAYIKRAVWYGVTGRTLAGLTGYVFLNDPVINLPPVLASMEENADGAGVTLIQQAKSVLRTVLGFGRCGLLVDYPTTSEPTTQQDILDGNIAPVIVVYQPEAITNWRESRVGARTYLDLIVLKEQFVGEGVDEFAAGVTFQYRVLTRTEKGVLGRIFRKKVYGSQFEVVEEYSVTDKSGTPIAEIPFIWIGSISNDSSLDVSPIQDLVNLNLAHFRNSADYEESCFIVGQPTPWISGLTEQWVKEVLRGQVQLGSRAIIPLPAGGQAGLLQATPNSMPSEAMKHKEEQMLALGAKLVEINSKIKTATEVNINQASEISVLVSAANNVFLAYKRAFLFCGLFVGQVEASVEFELSDSLTKSILTPQDAQAIMATWMGGLIDFEEARDQFRTAGWAWKPDEEAKESIAAEAMQHNPHPQQSQAPSGPDGDPEPSEQ